MSTVGDETEAAQLDTRLLAPLPGLSPSQSAQRALAAADMALFDAVAGDSAAEG